MKKLLTVILLFTVISNTTLLLSAQTPKKEEIFEKVELLVANGKRIGEKSARLHFLEGDLQIESVTNGDILKTFKYSDIKDAEYSYSKNPRWKTGLGLGAAAVVFLPILFVAIPLGFSKHRRHWLTIRTNNDYAVLKLSKRNRKLVLPAFESKTGIEVKGRGEDK